MAKVKTADAPVRRNIGQGLSIRAAAAELGWSYWSLYRAVQKGEARAVEFAGLKRLPPAEIERLRALFGPGEAA
jgi:transposase